MQSTSTPVRLIPSTTNPHILYRVSARGCTCPGYQFRKARQPDYRCRHMRAAAAVRIFWCAGCGQWPASRNSIYCSHCRPVEQLAAAVAAIITGPWCTCYRCQEPYAYNEQNPIMCASCAGGA